jgi:hypothetical protein
VAGAALCVTSLNSGGRTDEEVVANLKYLFSSPLIRAYWRAAERARKPIPPDSPEFVVAQKADEICLEYEAVVASAAEKNAGPAPTPLHERHGPAQAA